MYIPGRFKNSSLGLVYFRSLKASLTVSFSILLIFSRVYDVLFCSFWFSLLSFKNLTFKNSFLFYILKKNFILFKILCIDMYTLLPHGLIKVKNCYNVETYLIAGLEPFEKGA